MEYLLIPQEGDRKIMNEYIEIFENKTKQELVDAYNSQVKTGIVGVRRQALMIFALAVVFKKVFGETPITFEDNLVLGLSGQIKLVGEKYVPIAASAKN